jgi:hypothetical protein
MILQDYIKSVEFIKVAGAFKKMYPDDFHMLPYLKCHYDILCHTEPVYDENANSQECRISLYYDELVNKTYLSAYPLEGDKWSASLCKEVIIDPEVIATKEEIVACCLWHTSFYGYTEEQLAETAKDFSVYRDKTELEFSQFELDNSLAELKRIGYENISLPSYEVVKRIVKRRANHTYNNWKRKHINKRVRNRLFRKEFLKISYYQYLNSIARFIIDIWTPDAENLTLEEICKISGSKRFASYSYNSYSYGKCDGSDYLKELIFNFNGFNKDYIFSNVTICLIKPVDKLNLLDKEKDLCQTIYLLCPHGINKTVVKSDINLIRESKIIVGFYE